MSTITSSPSFDEGASYKERSQGFRDVAREVLRLVKMNKLIFKLTRADKNIANENKRIEAQDKVIKSAEKNVARAEYAISKLDEANPDYKELLEDRTEDLKENKEYVKIVEKEMVDITEDVAANIKDYEEHKGRVDETIAKVENGEYKVDMAELNALAEKMSKQYGTELVRGSANA